MIKLIIFDLDGVIVEAKNIHYESLNLAISKYDEMCVIDWNDHLSKYVSSPLMPSESPKRPPFGVKKRFVLDQLDKTKSLVDSIAFIDCGSFFLESFVSFCCTFSSPPISI